MRERIVLLVLLTVLLLDASRSTLAQTQVAQNRSVQAQSTPTGLIQTVGVQKNGYQKEIVVSQETRLDWTFSLANQSLLSPPAEWLQDYDSKSQTYELYVPDSVKTLPTSPARKSPPKTAGESAQPGGKNPTGLPLVLFISAGDQPAGWPQFQSVCQQQGMIFASPYRAGNNTPMPKRIHIVLDVLDDIRQHHKVDPDRTYIAGFSGGGRTACGIAFALPELFGGVIPICASGDLREEPWLRHRVIDRLSVALVTGSADFNQGEVERFRGPLLDGVGVRTQVTVVPQMGHAIPDGKALTKVIQWLDAGAKDRRKLAQRYPASRIDADKAPTRELWAAQLLTEGKGRLKDPKTLYSGLMQIQGVSQRWPDLQTAAEAKSLLVEYDSRLEHPWEADDIQEQRRFLIARAKGLTAYATGELPQQYAAQRKEMVQAAINLWMLVVQDGQDQQAVREGTQRLIELKQQLEKDSK